MKTATGINATDVLPAPESALDRLRGGVALAILLAIFVTLDPFADLSDPKLLEISSGRETATYLTLVMLVGFSGLILHWSGRLPLMPLATRANLLLLAWLAVVGVGLSIDPGASGRRFVLCVTTFLLAAMLPWLTRGLRHFTNLLLVTVVLVLVLSYLGVLVAPQLTIHQADDMFDPNVAGDWRGIYGHKNLAAGMMAAFLYVGWFVARTGRPLTGILVAIAASTFLLFSGGKSAIGMVTLVAVVAFFVAHVRSIWAKALFALGPLALINFLTVGSVWSDLARSIVALMPVDPTFTGRTDIWSFALESVAKYPLKGQGFEAFWYSEAVRYSAEDQTRWMVEVATSHNSYVDLALTIGLPGLALVMLAFVVAPLRDFHDARATRANREFSYLFLMLWLFALYFGTFEAFFLSRANPIWFMLAFATCGLRYLSQYDVRD